MLQGVDVNKCPISQENLLFTPLFHRDKPEKKSISFENNLMAQDLSLSLYGTFFGPLKLSS